MGGQSLVEFALASVVLILLFGGLVDLTRAIHFADVLQGAAREGARTGVTYSSADPANPNPALFDDAIQSAVNAQLSAGGLPDALLMNPSVNCPATADANAWHNPPYPTSAFPAVANRPRLFICYDNNAFLDFPSAPAVGLQGRDLNVILLMAYGPLTSVIPTSLGGNFGLATGVHFRIQGG